MYFPKSHLDYKIFGGFLSCFIPSSVLEHFLCQSAKQPRHSCKQKGLGMKIREAFTDSINKHIALTGYQELF